MRKRNSQSLTNLFGRRYKAQSTKILIDFIVRKIERNTGLTLQELKRSHPQKELYKIGLYHFTTTNKTICEALQIPVEAGTRRKRDLQKEGRLMASTKKRICPYTKHPARILSTNPDNYNDLLK